VVNYEKFGINLKTHKCEIKIVKKNNKRANYAKNDGLMLLKCGSSDAYKNLHEFFF
jgi:hypothetical protein